MLTCHFFMTMLAAMCGGPLLYGYNMAVVSPPAAMVRIFYTKVYGARAGLYPFPTNASTSTGTPNLTDSVLSGIVNGSLSNVTQLGQGELENQRLRLLGAELGVELLWTITIAICLIGGMLGAFASGRLADKLGRKKALLINQSFCLAGAALFAIVKLTNTPELLLVGRFLVGVASGVGLGLAPLYLSELATPALRGPATSSCHLAVTVGILLAQILGLSALLGTENGWPFLFAFTAVPSLVTLAILPFCPETPRYLLTARNAEYDQILRIYVWLYGPTKGEAEAVELRKETMRRKQSSIACNMEGRECTPCTEKECAVKPCDPNCDAQCDPSCSPCITENSKISFTVGDTNEKEAVTIGTSNDKANQDASERLLEGQPSTKQRARSGSSSRAITLGRLLCTEEFRLPIFLALWLHVTQQWSGINAVLAYSSTIFSDILPRDVVQYAVLSTGMASVLSTGVVLPFMGRLGRRRVVLVSCCGMAMAHVSLTLCCRLSSIVPELNYLAIVFVVVYICSYAGTGCTPAILVSEMFLQNARAVAMSLAIATRWGSAFLLLLAFPYMDYAMGSYVFLVFACVCLLSLVLFCVFLHETRGKPAVQVHDQLSHGFEHVQFHLPHLPHLPHFHHHHDNEHPQNDANEPVNHSHPHTQAEGNGAA